MNISSTSYPPSASRVVVCCHSAKADGDDGKPVMTTVASVSQAVGDPLESHKIDTRQRHDNFARQWFDVDPTPRLIADARLLVLCANEAAVRLFARSGSALLMEGQPLPIDTASADRISGLSARASSEGVVVPAHIPGRKIPLLIKAMPSNHDARFCWCLELRRMDVARLRAFAPLDEIFGLTRTETKIAQALTEGLTAVEVASKLGKSRDTVRCHIKALYAKIGVSSREALLTRLDAYRF